jgi:hypothetical protein
MDINELLHRIKQRNRSRNHWRGSSTLFNEVTRRNLLEAKQREHTRLQRHRPKGVWEDYDPVDAQTLRRMKQFRTPHYPPKYFGGAYSVKAAPATPATTPAKKKRRKKKRSAQKAPSAKKKKSSAQKAPSAKKKRGRKTNQDRAKALAREAAKISSTPDRRPAGEPRRSTRSKAASDDCPPGQVCKFG